MTNCNTVKKRIARLVSIASHSAEKSHRLVIPPALLHPTGNPTSPTGHFYAISHHNCQTIPPNQHQMIACDYPGCTAQYRRKEHLTRHARKHYPTVQRLTCDICYKTFDRTDSLRRHHQVHLREQGESIAPRASKACDRCHSSKTRCNGQEPCNVCSRRGLYCTFNRLSKRAPAGDDNYEYQTDNISDTIQDTEMQNNNAYDGLPTDPSLGAAPNHPTSFSSSEIQDLLRQHEDRLRAQGLLVNRDAEPGCGESQEPDNAELDFDHYVDVYFGHFHHHWPIVHGGSFRRSKEPQILLLAVVMIGLWVTGETGSQTRAVAMHEKLLTLLESRTDNWKLNIEFKDKAWPMTTHQAVILNIIFAVMRDARDDILRRCRIMLHAVTTTCKTGGLFSYENMRAQVSPTDSVLFGWTYIEELKRLALAIFKLNLHFDTGMLSLSDLTFPLPDSGYLFDATESKEFYRRYNVQVECGTCPGSKPPIRELVKAVQEGRKGGGLLFHVDPWLSFVVSQYVQSGV